MALTTLVKMQLEDKEFDQLFEAHQGDWAAMAHRARGLLIEQGADPTLDDIKKILEPLVEVDPRLRDHKVEHKAVGKRWNGDFTDYILHRVYVPTLPPPAAV